MHGSHHTIQNPRIAVAACALAFLAVIWSTAIGWSSLSGLLGIAGKNFFLIYLLCALAYFRLFRGWHRALGIVVSIALAAIAVGFFGIGQLTYALVLFLLGIVIPMIRRATPRVDRAGGPANSTRGT